MVSFPFVVPVFTGMACLVCGTHYFLSAEFILAPIFGIVLDISGDILICSLISYNIAVKPGLPRKVLLHWVGARSYYRLVPPNDCWHRFLTRVLISLPGKIIPVIILLTAGLQLYLQKIESFVIPLSYQSNDSYEQCKL